MKKKMSLVLAMLLLAATLTACGGNTAPSKSESASGDSVTIVYSNYGSSAMPLHFGLLDMIDYVETTSGGTIQYEYSVDGVLGDEYDMIQQLMDGTIQGAELSSSNFSTFLDVMDSFQLPFLIGDYETEYEVLTSDAAQSIYDRVEEELGIKIIGINEDGIRHFANTIRPIETLSDLKGLKLRIVPSNMLSEVMTNLGANPMSIGYNDVYSALQNNVVDGEEINITSIYAMKHYEQLKYLSLIGMYPFPSLSCYNAKFWNSLTPEQQDTIIEGHRIASENLFNQYLPEYEAEASDAMVEYGMVINEISDADREAFIEIAKKTWDTYREKDPLIADLIDYVESLK